MQESDPDLTQRITSRLSRGYTERFEHSVPFLHHTLRPATELNTTARELAQFVRMLIGRGSVDGTRLLSQKSVDRLEESQTLEAVKLHGLDGAYGLGNDSVYTPTRVLRGHRGAMPGFSAHYAYDAELGLGFVIMLNQDESSTKSKLVRLSARYLLRDFVPVLPEAVEVSEAELARYAGDYVLRTPRARSDHALAAFKPMIRVTYSEPANLIVNGNRYIATGEHTMRRVKRAESTLTYRMNTTHRRELRRAADLTYVQIPSWRATARLAFPVGMVLGAALIILYEILLFFGLVIRMLKPGDVSTRKDRRNLRLCSFASAAALVGAICLLTELAQHATENQGIREPNLVSLSFFGLTILSPVFATLSLSAAAFAPGEVSIRNRMGHGLMTGLILSGWLWLAQWGWIGIKLWTY